MACTRSPLTTFLSTGLRSVFAPGGGLVLGVVAIACVMGSAPAHASSANGHAASAIPRAAPAAHVRTALDAVISASETANGLPAGLLHAFHVRAGAAMAKAKWSGDCPTSGPFGYTAQRWLAAFSQASADLPDDIARYGRRIVQDADGVWRIRDVGYEAAGASGLMADVATSDLLMGLRDKPFASAVTAGLTAAANLAALGREMAEDDAPAADLYVGHLLGAETMMQVATAGRDAPGDALHTVVGTSKAQEILALSGLPDLDVSVPVGRFREALQGALVADAPGLRSMVKEAEPAAPTP